MFDFGGGNNIFNIDGWLNLWHLIFPASEQTGTWATSYKARSIFQYFVHEIKLLSENDNSV